MGRLAQVGRPLGVWVNSFSAEVGVWGIRPNDRVMQPLVLSGEHPKARVQLWLHSRPIVCRLLHVRQTPLPLILPLDRIAVAPLPLDLRQAELPPIVLPDRVAVREVASHF